jgi:hypothetical protein
MNPRLRLSPAQKRFSRRSLDESAESRASRFPARAIEFEAMNGFDQETGVFHCDEASEKIPGTARP